MNENIDLTKILKDCPKGYEFYSSYFGKVTFVKISYGRIIVGCPKIHRQVVFNTNGKYVMLTYSDNNGNYLLSDECLLFPSKDQIDWSKFTAPWYKKERDTIDWIKKQCEPNPYSGVSFKYNGHTWGMCGRDNGVEILVDGEIKERIFLDNKPQGKQTNERAWLYLVSDVLTWKDGIGQYLDDPRVQELAKRLCSEYAQKLYNHSNSSNTGKNEQKSADKIEPKFKVGDRVRHKETNKDDVYEISKVYDDSYGIDGFTWMIYMKYQDQYELIPNKFDPKTLSPFDKVLVKISNESYNTWFADFVAEPAHVKNETPLILGAKEANMVIPYNEETKHLVGTNDEAPEYYRYWEK